MSDDFPTRYAATHRFSLGEPRDLRISPDGQRVAFLRSRGPQDPVNCLWVLNVITGQTVLAADPADLRGGEEGDPLEEQARRERRRESAEGIVTYGTDEAVTLAAFSLGGHLFLAHLSGEGAGRHPTPETVVDPRLSPDGRWIAYVSDGELRVVAADGAEPARLGADEQPVPRTPAGERMVTWGLADFIAAEELDRQRGFWWSPDSERIAVSRVDSTEVVRWYLDDLSDPRAEPRTIAYPQAGTANARVSLYVLGLDGARTEVRWDQEMFPYLAVVSWRESHPLTLTVLSRDQRHLRVLTVDPDTGASRVHWEDHGQLWLELVPGAPRWLPDGRLLHTLDSGPRTSVAGERSGDTRLLAVDGRPVSPEGLQVRSIINADDETVTITASGDDPTAVAVWRVPLGGGDPTRLTPAEGVHDATARGSALVVQRRALDRTGLETVAHTPHGDTQIPSEALDPPITPHVRMLELGSRGLRAALLVPSDYDESSGAKLPVLLDPYGGPHAQRVLQGQNAFLVSQWFADQGFAVLVADGRGTPGRGPAWEQEIAFDLATAPLEDQVDALAAAADEVGFLDLDKVAVRGWSFGGFLAALAVLRRPEVFSAAIAGAPVTDWRLYDTAYTERYLGHPEHEPEAYRRSSLIDDAPNLRRPLLLIHGLADDNVVVAHTLQLSAALVLAARPHTVLPLSNVTHMTPQVTITESLLRLQLSFLRDALQLSGVTDDAAMWGSHREPTPT